MTDPVSDLEKMAPMLVLLRRLQENGLDRDVELIVPTGVLPGVTSAWAVPVRHIDGLDTVYLAHRVPLGTQALITET